MYAIITGVFAHIIPISYFHHSGSGWTAFWPLLLIICEASKKKKLAWSLREAVKIVCWLIIIICKSKIKSTTHNQEKIALSNGWTIVCRYYIMNYDQSLDTTVRVSLAS